MAAKNDERVVTQEGEAAPLSATTGAINSPHQ